MSLLHRVVISMMSLLISCQDEDEFPELAPSGSAQRNAKADSNTTQTQAKIHKNLVRTLLVSVKD